MAKKKFYVVRVGRKTGIYETWAECETQVKGFAGAIYKSFTNHQEALNAFENGWDSNKKTTKSSGATTTKTKTAEYIENSISVDAACSGNPGEMEYQGVHTGNGSQYFKSKIYPVGTNNLGEFLAVVDGLRILKEEGSNKVIYTDSQSAMAWVRDKRVKTNLERNERTKELWEDIDDALLWLENNTYNNRILKWDTKSWGEIKADFGRK